jgi:hypothetical protein
LTPTSQPLAWSCRLPNPDPSDVLGIDPGVHGGAVLLRGFCDVPWAAHWHPHHSGDGMALVISEPLTGRVLRFTEPNLWRVLERLPTAPGTRCTVERMFIGPHPKSDLDVLIEASGIAVGWAMSRGLRLTARPMASRWRADLLAMPTRSDAKTCNAALADVLAGRAPKHLPGEVIAHGITGNLGLLNEHSRDALALAAWGAGVRLTRSSNRANESKEAT